MRNLAQRATWVAAVVATALAVGSPTAAGLTSAGGTRTATARTTRVVADDAFGDATVVEATGAAVGDRPPAAAAPSAPRPVEPSGHLLVRVPHNLTVRAHPNAKAHVVGTLPSGSKYYDVPTTAWVEERSPDGRWGRVEIPYVWPRRAGWIALRGLPRSTTDLEVRIDLSERRITVTRSDRVLFGVPAAIGAAASPTPVGEYFVTDRVPFAGGSLGTFAFGISGIQPNLPPGWSGGNQLAIHGTNDPSSIGRSASAGCLRVSERSLDQLKPLLQLGTPVIVSR